MEYFLEIKIIFLVLLFFMTLLFGLVPLKFVRDSTSAPGGPVHGLRSRLFVLLSSTTAGVFLATCLLDLLPDYLSSMQEALSDLRAKTDFPLAEFILAVGFFAVMLLEQAVLFLHDRTAATSAAAAARGSSETRALLSSTSPSPTSEAPPREAFVPRVKTVLPSLSAISKPAAAAADLEPGHWGPGASAEDAEVGAHLHVDQSSHSAVRAWGLLVSLALHSALEGLAVGLQRPGAPGASAAGLVGLCAAVAVHKCAVASGLCVRLVQARLGRRAAFAALLGFALASPVGVAVGVALLDSPALAESHMPRAVLQGLATGTFLYVTFLEILPHELNSQHCRLLRAVCLLAGFSVITVTLFATT